MVGLLVTGLTLWTCYDVTVHPPETGSSRGTLAAITAFLALVALAVALFSFRLLIPRLRVEGGHVITLQGLVGFVLLYIVAMIASLVAGSSTVAGLVPGILVALGAAVLIWERLRARRAQ